MKIIHGGCSKTRFDSPRVPQKYPTCLGSQSSFKGLYGLLSGVLVGKPRTSQQYREEMFLAHNGISIANLCWEYPGDLSPIYGNVHGENVDTLWLFSCSYMQNDHLSNHKSSTV